MNQQTSPYIRLAWYDILQPNTYIRERIIFDYELLYIKTGKALITVEDELYEGTQGDIFIFRPGQRHSIRIINNMQLVQPHIHFDLLYYEDRADVPISFKTYEEMDEKERAWIRPDITSEFISPFPSHIHPQSPLYIEQLIFDVIHAFNNKGPFSELSMKWLFLRLWVQLLSEISLINDRKVQRKSDALHQVKLYMEQNINRRITLDELARVHHFSKSYLSRLFKDLYQTSPLQYHATLRVQKAKELICYTNMSLSEISELLNFENLQDFSRVFKKAEGIAPSAYRHPSLLADRQMANWARSGDA